MASSQRLDIAAHAERLAGDVAAERRDQEQRPCDATSCADTIRRSETFSRYWFSISAIGEAELLGAGADDALDARAVDDAGQDGVDA